MIFGRPVRWWFFLWLGLLVAGFVVSLIPGVGRFLAGLLFLVEIPVFLLLMAYVFSWLLPFTIRAWLDGGSSRRY